MKYGIKKRSLKFKYTGCTHMANLRIALCQMNPVVGDLACNISKMKEWVVEAENNGANLVVFPELVISGYPPQDNLLYDGINRDLEKADKDFFGFLQRRNEDRHGGSAIVVWGNVRRGKGLRNSAKIFLPADSTNGFPLTHARHQDKRRLPNYGVFDELRYLARYSFRKISSLESLCARTFGTSKTICRTLP